MCRVLEVLGFAVWYYFVILFELLWKLLRARLNNRLGRRRRRRGHVSRQSSV